MIKNTGREIRVTGDKSTFNIQPNHTLATMGFYSSVLQETQQNTGCFVTNSGITKIYYRKNVGHVFTKPVKTEGTTQNFFPQ